MQGPLKTGSASRNVANTAAVLLGCALAACAALPQTGRSPTPKPPGAYATAQSFTAPESDWPTSEWWRAYGDAELDQLIDESLKSSPTMAQAQARIDKARADVGTARAALFPTLSANGSVTEAKQSYNYGIPPMFVPHGYNDYAQGTLNFTYEFDFWGKNRAAVAAATSESRAAQADAAEARLALSTAVAGAYADLARLYDERDVAERSAQSRQETLDLVLHRVANGADNRGASMQAEAEVNSAKADVAAIDEEIGLTRDQLAALLGEGPDRGLAIARPAAPSLKAFGLPPSLAADLIGRRPDVVAARWRAEAAAKRIGVARAQFYPDINLVADIGFEALHVHNFLAPGSDIGSVGPAGTLPIFEGGRLRANLRGANADYAAAVASYDAALTQALSDVADAAQSERALTDRLAKSQAALDADEEAYRIARLRYEGGLSDYQSVLLVEDSVLAARRTVVDLKARAFALDIQLVKALGGGFQLQDLKHG
ncbi:MAG TPA: efflux transporter outer membrane subunit [Caulobacteraceae bacterium]|jgi:NodT family efflux transporter outer membrane factor (OMF) lipoprotein|nr:efflux transporter outer membrane subunit [Caulobacteraceae bacterium]